MGSRPEAGFAEIDWTVEVGSDILINASQNWLDWTDTAGAENARAHPLLLAAEHCLAMRNAIHELPDPLLHRMIDMLLLEIGRAIAEAETAEKRRQMT